MGVTQNLPMHIKREPKIELIPIEKIHILNPRSRNQKVFAQLVENIATIGLKRPISVTKSEKNAESEYELVCGQGRLEALQILGEKFIPASIIDVQEEEQYLISLVENLARRKHSNKELLSAIQHLSNLGYNNQQISTKIGTHSTYVGSILFLLRNGEERLIAAVEKGWLPIDLALNIAKTEDSDTQIALLDSYEQGKLTSHEIMKVRRIIAQRKIGGKAYNLFGKNNANKPTPEKLLKIYKSEMYRQKVMINKADINEQWLTIIVSSLRQLLKDDHFKTLLRAENIVDMPEKLRNRINNGDYSHE